MSQFLNQVQRIEPTGTSAVPFDVAQITSTLAGVKEAAPEQPSNGNGGNHLASLLDGLAGAASVTEQLGQSRLSKCRMVEIPQSSAKLLLPDSDIQGGSVAEAYKGMRTRLLRAQATEGLRSVCISSALPNEGKTLTSINLSLCCAQLSNMRVLLVDGDLRTGGLSSTLGADGPGLSEVLMGTASYEEAIVSTTCSRNLFVLPAGIATVPPPELFAGPRWKEVTGWAAECFNLVIVDTPPILSVADFELIATGCDRTLLVVRAHRTLRETLERTLEKIDRKKLMGTIFNAMEWNPDSRRDGYYHNYGSYGRPAEQRHKHLTVRSKTSAAEK